MTRLSCRFEVFCVLLLMSAVAVAEPVTAAYNFTANFTAGPVTTLNGSFAFTLDYDLLNQARHLDSVSLVLPGHVYTTDETYVQYYPDFFGADNVSVQTELGVDSNFSPYMFDLIFNRKTLQFVSFQYADESGQDWSTTEGLVSSVPEPSSLLLLGSGALGLLAVIRRKLRG